MPGRLKGFIEHSRLAFYVRAVLYVCKMQVRRRSMSQFGLNLKAFHIEE